MTYDEGAQSFILPDNPDMHEFITYKIPDDEDDIDDAEEEGGDVSSEDEE